MKTEQILLVIEISKCGSISKAAQRLFIAQPNASNAIYALEQELGYQILDRTHNGVTFTQKGEKFLQYAGTIQRNLDNIYLLKQEIKKIRLSVATYAYSFTENAFVRFCKTYVNSAKTLKCSLKRIGTVKEGVDMLVNDLADISLIVCRRELYGFFETEFKGSGLLPILLGYTALYITMSDTHPMADRESANLMDFAEYPCVTNAGLSNNYVPPEVEELLRAVKMHIVIGPNNARLALLGDGKCFSISTPYPKKMLEEHRLISRRLPDAERNIVLLIREEERFHEELMVYIDFVHEEIKKWMDEIA